MSYASDIKRILTSPERATLKKLDSPQKIQHFLDGFPINFERSGETYMSPRRTLREKTAHCFEGALFAAAALAYHGRPPLLMDFRTVPEDEDHVVALFQEHGYWGAISKTNHGILRYRDPIFRTARELAASYFHEYIMWEDGRKTLREYSKSFDLTKYPPQRWVTAAEDLFWLVEALDAYRHFPLVPKKNIKKLRRASAFEIRAMRSVEWKPRKKRVH